MAITRYVSKAETEGEENENEKNMKNGLALADTAMKVYSAASSSPKTDSTSTYGQEAMNRKYNRMLPGGAS